MTTLIIPTTVHPADTMWLRQVAVTAENDEFEIELSIAGAHLIFQRKLKSATGFAQGRDVQSIGLEDLVRAWIAAIDDGIPTEDDIVEAVLSAVGVTLDTDDVEGAIRLALAYARGEQR